MVKWRVKQCAVDVLLSMHQPHGNNFTQKRQVENAFFAPLQIQSLIAQWIQSHNLPFYYFPFACISSSIDWMGWECRGRMNVSIMCAHIELWSMLSFTILFLLHMRYYHHQHKRQQCWNHCVTTVIIQVQNKKLLIWKSVVAIC